MPRLPSVCYTTSVRLDEHQFDEDGLHYVDDCEPCFEQNHSVGCERKCGRCCEQMIIETSLRDADREPRIRQCPTLRGFADEIEGYLLNGEDGPCTFFDLSTRLCIIHETRPLVCRVFHCEKKPPSEEEGRV